ncbi:hypothetical protein [Archangium lansingense]|uniref:Uncharacterized protein n=1 Tax=Archangium lansingense TaxID=2995310 RepID=A0ABT4AA78_9BACT|nr:hypothetical protein [Archangium lansinium]MCY1078568.1 hypothetical protein [Archangium lansinium]
MSWKILPLWLCLAFPVAACAQSTSAERPAEDAPRGPPVIKSSLAVLLEHSTELALTAEQVAWLEQREQQLQQENAPLKQKRGGWPPIRPDERMAASQRPDDPGDSC